MIRKSDFLSRQIFIQITFRRTYVRNPPHNCIAQASIHSPNIDLHLLPTPLIFGAGLGSLQNWYADGVPTDLLGKHTQPKPPSGLTQPPSGLTQPPRQPRPARPGSQRNPSRAIFSFVHPTKWMNKNMVLYSFLHTHNLSFDEIFSHEKLMKYQLSITRWNINEF